jgi:nicotinate-nucleotide pyrophosphorylase (carboxylating)
MKGVDSKVLDQFIDAALFEDIQDGDHTSNACIDPNATSKAKLYVKDNGVISGIAFAQRVFAKVDPESKMEILIEDGKDVKFGDIAFYVECNSQALLKAERLILNTMQRLSLHPQQQVYGRNRRNGCQNSRY